MRTGPKVIDLVGKKFNRLTVISLVPGRNRQNGKKIPTRWVCRCDCGEEKIVQGTGLKNGTTKSCGCYNKEIKTKRIPVGTRFGRLVVLKEDGMIINRLAYLCQCDCGNTHRIAGTSLRRGTRSCGCLTIEKVREINLIHGQSMTREYALFHAEKRRDAKLKLDKGWTLAMRKALKFFQKVCVLCGGTNKLSIDHVKPLSHGFGLEPGNAVILCGSCNASKRNKDLEQLDETCRNIIITKAQEFKQYWEGINHGTV